MCVPISKFRKEIFALAEAALKGAAVEFTHKGVTFRVTPEQATDKLKNITPLQVVNPEYSLESAATQIRTEMETEWEKDWGQL